jgi:hypothetical protein
VPILQRRDHEEPNMLAKHAGTEHSLLTGPPSLNERPGVVQPLRSKSGKEAELQMSLRTQLEISAHAERHYAVAEIAEMWNLSADKVRSLFEQEPGVLTIGERNPRHKRRYVTLRIPQSVVERVYHRLSSKTVAR